MALVFFILGIHQKLMSSCGWPIAMEQLLVAQGGAKRAEVRLKAFTPNRFIAHAKIHWKVWAHARQVRHRVVEAGATLRDMKPKHR